MRLHKLESCLREAMRNNGIQMHLRYAGRLRKPRHYTWEKEVSLKYHVMPQFKKGFQIDSFDYMQVRFISFVT